MASGRMRWSAAIATIACVVAIALFAGATPATTQRSQRADPPTKIAITATPIAGFDHGDPSRRVFGMLEYRGGLVLTSDFREFGGLSTIRVAADGAKFIAANDKAWWLRGRITYAGNRPSGIADAEMAPMLAADGRPITAVRRWYDTEAIAEDGGTLYVSLERVHSILRFDYGRHGLLARGHAIDVPKAMRKLRSNKGVEALVVVPRGQPLGGALIAITERGYQSKDNHLAFLIGGPRPGQFAIRRKDDFDVSDASLLPNGDLLLLERKFGWTTGLFVRIRRIPLRSVKPGVVLDGPAVFEADLGQQIDNLEGLSVHRTSGGELVLTLISDNNFSALQRTLLLQFTLAQP